MNNINNKYIIIINIIIQNNLKTLFKLKNNLKHLFKLKNKLFNQY